MGQMKGREVETADLIRQGQEWQRFLVCMTRRGYDARVLSNGPNAVIFSVSAAESGAVLAEAGIEFSSGFPVRAENIAPVLATLEEMVEEYFDRGYRNVRYSFFGCGVNDTLSDDG